MQALRMTVHVKCENTGETLHGAGLGHSPLAWSPKAPHKPDLLCELSRCLPWAGHKMDIKSAVLRNAEAHSLQW